MRRYQCTACGHVFLSKRKQESSATKHLIAEDYIFHKQTYSELCRRYGKDRRRLQNIVGNVVIAPKVHDPRPLHLVVDATYFGEKEEKSLWCVLVARDPKRKENLAWCIAKVESTSGYVFLREELEAKGYTILSVTGDGFSGIRSAFHDIPFQMCQVHMRRLVVYGTTNNPLTEAGQVLLALTKTLPKTHSYVFAKRLTQFTQMYRSFLQEQTIHPFTGEKSFTHEGVRQAYMSLMRLQKYLFTYEQNDHIPKTTNSLEGHFRHVKKHLGTHAGLSLHNQQKILATIVQASSVAPKQSILATLWK